MKSNQFLDFWIFQAQIEWTFKYFQGAFSVLIIIFIQKYYKKNSVKKETVNISYKQQQLRIVCYLNMHKATDTWSFGTHASYGAFSEESGGR